MAYNRSIRKKGNDMTIEVKQAYNYSTSVAVVERDEDGFLLTCNHDCDSDWEDFDSMEFDADSGCYAPTGTQRLETCGKCGAINYGDGEFGEIPEEIR